MTEPMYRRIAEELRREIQQGSISPGTQIPTELELMETHNASRNTVRDAIKLLAMRGLIETRPGQGTFVTEKIDPFVTTLTGNPVGGAGGGEGRPYASEVQAHGRKHKDSDPRVEIQRADPVVADALGIAVGDSVVSRHQQRFIDGKLWSLQTSFYPKTLIDKGAARLLSATSIEEGAVAYLAGELGLRQVGYRDSILVRSPDENEVNAFKLPSDGRVPVFEISRLSFDEDGGRIRLTVTACPADRNRFVINVGTVPPSAGETE